MVDNGSTNEKLVEEGAVSEKIQQEGTGFTPRAVIVSLLFMIFATYIWLDISYETVWGLGFKVYRVYFDAYAPNNHSLLPIFAIVLVLNPIIKLLGSKAQFTKKEILTVTNMTQFGILVLASGYFQRFVSSTMMGVSIHGVTDPHTYGNIAERFSKPFFVGTDELRRWFEEGPGPLIWSEWIGPFITWTLFLFVMVWLFFCLAVMVRKRWTEREHLRYPIGVMTLAYINGAATDEDAPGSLWKNKLIWIGIAIAFAFNGMTYLHGIWPWIPDIDMNLKVRDIRTSLFRENPTVHAAFYLSTFVHPVIMGAMWFVTSLDVLFSIWVFYLFRGVVSFILMKTGTLGLMQSSAPSAVTDVMNVATVGAVLGLTGSYLWVSRHDIFDFIKKGLGLSGAEEVDDSEEPISYRLAFFSILGSILFFAIFCKVVLQMSVLLSFVLILYLICLAFSLARMRSEASVAPQLGLGPNLRSQLTVIGARTIGIDNAGAGALEALYSRPLMCFMGGFLEAWKMGDDLGEDRRTVSKGILLSILIGTLLVAFIALPHMYREGFNATLSRNRSYATGWANFARTVDLGNIHAQPGRGILWAFSFVIVVLLGFLRSMYAWWPLHPVGYVVGTSSMGNYFIDMAFVVWLIKSLVLRYGGYQSFRKFTPIFLGLGLGQILVSIVGLALWSLQLIGAI